MPTSALVKPVETCWMCGKPIPSIDRIVDEFGYPVHMACYSLQDSARPKQVPPKYLCAVSNRTFALRWAHLCHELVSLRAAIEVSSTTQISHPSHGVRNHFKKKGSTWAAAGRPKEVFEPNRHRGTGRPASPATPPYMRVRIRRFGGLS